MLREWLLTPIINAQSQKKLAYSAAHCGMRCSVEWCTGVVKCRWLHSDLRVAPAKACKIIWACLILHNKVTQLHHPLPEDLQPSNEQPDAQILQNACPPTEQAHTAAAKLARQHLIQQFIKCFTTDNVLMLISKTSLLGHIACMQCTDTVYC